MKRIVMILLCLAIVLSACPVLPKEADAPFYDEVFVIVHTNDVHGFIDVEPYVKAVADDMKARYGEGNVITVSAGDVFSGGSAVAHLYGGETIPPIMDAAGYDVLVPGNNDFFFGMDRLLELAGMFDHTTMLCANLFEQDEDGTSGAVRGRSVFDRTRVLETEGGVRIGLFGLTVAGGAMRDGFCSLGTVDGAREATGILEDEGCAVIVGIGHTGWNDDLVTPSVNDVTSAEPVKEVPGIDVYIDAHSHSVINGGSGWVCPETGTLVNQASGKGACVGVVRLYLRDGAVAAKEAELLTDEYLATNYAPDPAVRALVDAAWERLAGDSGEMYIESPYFLNASRVSESRDGRSVRADETNLGDLVADFVRDYTGADAAMVPGCMIRCSVEKGKVFTLDLYNVFAIGCRIYVLDVTGEELLRYMAISLSGLPSESPSFCQISGMSFGYLKEFTLSEDGEKVFTIIDPTAGGEGLEPGRTYRVALSLFDDGTEGLEPELSTMEEAAAAMGEYLRSGRAVILPDVPLPGGRIVPMDDVPSGAAVFEVTAETETVLPGG